MMYPENTYRSINGIHDKLERICRFYKGEQDNPYDVTSANPEDRKIEFLKYHLWDMERSLVSDPGGWRFRLIEEKGSIPTESEEAAKSLYDYAADVKLNMLESTGVNVRELYKQFRMTFD